jgi:hypothetical protein
LHSAKLLSRKISADARITISVNPVARNAVFSIRDNLELDSNARNESKIFCDVIKLIEKGSQSLTAGKGRRQTIEMRRIVGDETLMNRQSQFESN